MTTGGPFDCVPPWADANALARPYPEMIEELERKLEITRQQYHDADHMLRLVTDDRNKLRVERDHKDRLVDHLRSEMATLRSEASELMAENAGLIQANDALKRDKAELHRANEELLDNYVAVRASREFLEEGGNRQAEQIKQVVDANRALVAENAWLKDNAKQQAEVIREQGAEIEGQKMVLDRQRQLVEQHHAHGVALERDLASLVRATGQHDLPPTRAEEEAESAFYTDEENDVHRQQLRDAHATAKAEVKRRGVELHPRIAANRVATDANEEREG